MNIDNFIAHTILQELHANEQRFIVYQLRDKIASKCTFTSMEFERVKKHLINEEYIEIYEGYDITYPHEVTLTFKGKSFYLTGGYLPTNKQRIRRWIKSDGGYGNSKWVITVVLTIFSICFSIIMALIRK